MKTNRIYMILSAAVLLLLWKIIAMLVGKSIIIPSPEETLQALIVIITQGHFVMRVLNTMGRVLISFTVAFLGGLCLGVLAGFFEPMYYLMKPVVLIQKSIPTMAVVLIAIIWLGSDLAPTLVGVLIIFPMIYATVADGIINMDPNLLEMADVYQFGHKKRLKHLYLPVINSALWSVSSVALGLNMKIIIAGEVLSQPNLAMGTAFQIEKAALNTAGVFAWAFVAIIIAALFDWVLAWLRKRFSQEHSI